MVRTLPWKFKCIDFTLREIIKNRCQAPSTPPAKNKEISRKKVWIQVILVPSISLQFSTCSQSIGGIFKIKFTICKFGNKYLLREKMGEHPLPPPSHPATSLVYNHRKAVDR